jgi:phage tail sheath protein FI
MRERQAPGPRLREVDVRTERIAPSDTSVTALLGTCPDGPADEPVAVHSLVAFDRVYRGSRGSSLHREVRDFFSNGGRQALTVRVTKGSAALDSLAEHDWQLLVVDPDVVDLTRAHAVCVRHRGFLICDATGDGTLPVAPGSNAAAYFPPLTSGPCAAAVAGVVARIDATRGVWKAPSGVEAGVAGTLSRELTAHEIQRLGAGHVNALRTLPTGGAVVWGARTASTDPEWRYVSVRRFVLFLERSIERGLQWAVFEPNDEPAWAAARQTVSTFLFDLWRQGAAVGTTPEEGFFVTCDRSTMTQADLDAGRLVVLVGVAPLEPAEFVVIRIQVRTSPTA